MYLATATEKSSNSKVGPASVTSAAQESCPKSCAWYGAGCYAESGFQGLYVTSKLNRSVGDATAEDVARVEAAAIDGLSGKQDLRVHIVGDSKTNRIARLVSAAADRHRAKHGKRVWSYTHAWREVLRKSWGKVSVLASCETLSDIRHAWSRGYAACVVVTKFQDTKAWVKDGIKMVPCPHTLGKVENCVKCGLCMRGDWLFESKTVVVFEAHGGGKRKMAEKLIQIGGM